jgi:DNA primase
MDAPQEIKSRLDVADIVGEYLSLKPAGTGSFKALCPFHGEKTPSFYVNRGRQSWHCFGCDKGGDVISFVMDMEGMGFRDALEHLAVKAGVTLPELSPQDLQRSGERKRLHEINELAAKFFRATLLQLPEAEHARAYAAKRNIDDLTGDLFKIGYAPNGWDGLTKALLARGISADELIAAGLSVKNPERGTVYDRFRDRLMFTIQDLHGNVVGFTGRLLQADAKEAKYVNTPETAVYKKSQILYGLDKAKGEIKRLNLAVITEGNMDVLSSHKAGITNVVCSSGTALTEEQLKLLQRFTKNLAIAFDADAAGMAATLRGLDLARSQDFNIKLITLPPEAGKDPDDAVNKDPALWKEAIAKAHDVMDWVFHAAFRGRDLSSAEDKRKIAADILPEIRRIADPISRDHWINKLASALSVTAEVLRETLKRTASPKGPTTPRPVRRAEEKPGSPQALSLSADRRRDLSERILALFLAKNELMKQADDQLEQDISEPLRGLYRALKDSYTSEQSNEFKELVDYLTIRADRDFPDQSLAALSREYVSNRELLRQLNTVSARQRLEQELRAAELSGDRERIAELAKAFQQLIRT